MERDREIDPSAPTETPTVTHASVTPGAAITQRAERDPLIGKAIGRYQVLARLGAGGMGVVYRALDPALDRPVALKVLPPLDEERRTSLEERLRREAQALAKLDHENVLAVYDVGHADASLFLAMQFVDGTTLDAYVDEHQPSPRRTLELFVAAGRGLAAAHAAGIVHRDVKPSNILVDRAGRVYVGDFGLARGAQDVAPEQRSGSDLLVADMTRAGAVVGTPLFMAPEQHRGELATERSDQFSFCVSAWLELFGKHPFVARGWDAQAALGAMEADRIVEPPRVTGLPPRALRALRRGLRHDPSARWPAMTDLLAELAPASRSRWLLGGLTVAGLAAGAGAAWLAGGLLASSPDPCVDAAQRMTAIATPARYQAIVDGFAATKLPYAVETATRVRATLDRYASAWTAMRVDTCKANRVRHEQSDELFDRRVACLDRRAAALDTAFGALATHPTPDLVDRAAAVTDSLPPIADCADLARLTAADTHPLDPEARRKVEALSDDITRARTELSAGVLVGATAKAEALVARARTAGSDGALAAALDLAARAYHQVGDNAHSLERMREAAVAAGRAHDDAAAADALGFVAATLVANGRPAEALVVLADTEVFASRAETPTLRAQLETARGDALAGLSRFDEARAAYDKALATVRGDPQHTAVQLAEVLMQQSDMLKRASKLPEALAAARECEAIYTRELGADHPRLADVHARLGAIFLGTGDFTEARKQYERAAAIMKLRFPADSTAPGKLAANLALIDLREGKLDQALASLQATYAELKQTAPDHPDTYQLLYLIGIIRMQQGKYDDALEALETVRDFRLVHLGDDNIATANVLDALGNIYQARGDAAKARETREKGLAIRIKALGADNPDVALSMQALAGQALDQGDCAQASDLARRALVILDKAQVRDRDKIDATDIVGACELRAGHLTEARERLEPLVAIADAPGGTIDQRATVRADLAEVLWAAGDHARARSLVTEARDIYAAAGRADDAADLAAWLKHH